MLETLKLVVQVLLLLTVVIVPVAEIIWALKMMNTTWDIRYREQKIKLEAEDLQRREHVLLESWERLHTAQGKSMETKLAEKKQARSDSDPNMKT